jgi:hypothetical protein
MSSLHVKALYSATEADLARHSTLRIESRSWIVLSRAWHRPR